MKCYKFHLWDKSSQKIAYHMFLVYNVYSARSHCVLKFRVSNELYFRVRICFPVMMKIVSEMAAAVLVVAVSDLLLQVLIFCLVCIMCFVYIDLAKLNSENKLYFVLHHGYLMLISQLSVCCGIQLLQS